MLDIRSSQFDRGICAGKKGGYCWRDGFDNFFRRFVDAISKVVRGKVRDLFVQVVKSVIANFRNMLAGVLSGIHEACSNPLCVLWSELTIKNNVTWED